MGYINHSNFLKKFGYRIRELRDKKGITQQELSFRTDLSRNQIGRIERGEINAGLSTINELAVGLEISVKELFDFEV